MIRGNPLKHFIYSFNVDTGATQYRLAVEM